MIGTSLVPCHRPPSFLLALIILVAIIILLIILLFMVGAPWWTDKGVFTRSPRVLDDRATRQGRARLAMVPAVLVHRGAMTASPRFKPFWGQFAVMATTRVFRSLQHRRARETAVIFIRDFYVHVIVFVLAYPTCMSKGPYLVDVETRHHSIRAKQCTVAANIRATLGDGWRGIGRRGLEEA